MSVLSINSLNKHYGKLHAVKNISFEIEAGQAFGLLGPNGSGKTTTLGMLLGVLNKDKGNFKWFGEDLSKSIKKRIGAILETPNFYPYLSGKRNLQIVCYLKDAPLSKIDEVLEFTGLKGREGDQFKKYSLGMKQRLAIAVALVSDPEVLVLDEPTNGLDPQGIKDVREMIRKLADSGKTIILASHLLDEVQKVCSHTAILKQGELLYNGKIETQETSEFIIDYSNHDKIIELASNNAHFKISGKEDDKFVIEANNLNGSSVNRLFAEQGIYLESIIQRKAGLEKLFF
jgi:ABC-2 type transport system ATP-binding protein